MNHELWDKISLGEKYKVVNTSLVLLFYYKGKTIWICRCEVDLHETVFAAPIFGLGVTDDAVYFGTYYDGAVLSVRLHRGEAEEQPGEETEQPREQGEEEEHVPVIEIKDLTTRELFSIAINDPDLQPIGEPAIFSFRAKEVPILVKK